ncbi:MAG TPA: nuclear transport factor 2 family protein [Caulobacteraceae bacterium]|nr:nuclear transport factor 2 family protein [Caulobacteraceae bacterium]
MSTQQIAEDLVALCREGKFDAAGEKYWADDVVSLEAMGDMAESRGKSAVKAKGEWWNSTFEVNDSKVEGPYVNGDSFIVRFTMTTTNRQSGEKASMDETALYRVKDGKIAEERFFSAA